MNKRRLALERPTTEKGFTLVEVLVGILLILTFVGVSTQALVLSTVFKVRGQELSEATTWIQEDLENIRFEASRLNFDLATRTAQDQGIHGARCSSVDATSGYADLLRDELAGAANTSITSEDINRSSAIGARPYFLRRTLMPSTTPPYNVMEVRYAVYAANEAPGVGGVPGTVTDTDAPDAIATSYSEIIPNVSFTCR